MPPARSFVKTRYSPSRNRTLLPLAALAALAAPVHAQQGRVIGPESGQEQIAPLFIAREEGVLIRNVRIVGDGTGACVDINESRNIELDNVELRDCGEFGINASTVDGLDVIDSRFEAATKGVYVQLSRRVRVSGNDFVGEMRNFVQFDKVSGPGNEISYNSGANRAGSPVPEDLINVFKSHGTVDSPIRIIGNDLSGGGSSPTGSGIMVGDEGGSYQLVLGNSLDRPGQVGIGVAGGKHIRVLWNRVVQASQKSSNVGIYVWNQSPDSCGYIQVADNDVEWFNEAGIANPWWDGLNCHPVMLQRNALNGLR